MPDSISSTLTTQKLVNYARLFPWTTPTLGVAGAADEPALSFVNEIIQKVMARSNPWKWNAAKMPVIETQPYQQDYPTSISQNVLGWLQAAVSVDINNVSSLPKVMPPMTVVQSLLPTYLVRMPTKVCWITNAIAQTGTWPGANSVYKDPLVANGGGPGNNPLTAITDPNGNIQVVTTYGTTGSVAPAWPAVNATAGTTTVDGTVVWTVQDPNGVALRLDSLATNGSVVWEIRSLYQQKPPVITSLSQTLAPIPDDLGFLIKQGFLAYCYKQVDRAQFQAEFQQWLIAIQEALGASDRELSEFGFYPAHPLQGGPGQGGIGTYSYPGWLGWQ